VECQEGSYDAFTLELRVVPSSPESVQVAPFTHKILRCDDDEYEKTKEKWEVVDFSPIANDVENHPVDRISTTVAVLRDYAIEAIREHGKYSALTNNCQDFVKCLLEKLAKEQGSWASGTTTDTQKVVHSVVFAGFVGTNVSVQAVAGAVVGVGALGVGASMVVGPLAAYTYTKQKNRAQRLESQDKDDDSTSGDD